jgi:CDP-4-dehydro-6-deoxyglucose reductase
MIDLRAVNCFIRPRRRWMEWASKQDQQMELVTEGKPGNPQDPAAGKAGEKPVDKAPEKPAEKQPEKPKGRQILKFRLTEVRDYTPRIRELFLQCEDPTEFGFRCGQFVMLHVPTAAKPALRAYSLASDDRVKNGFRLLFNFVDGGVASAYVWALKAGDIVDMTGPFGRLFFKEPPTEQVIFLNTGSGVSQHFSYLESMQEKYPHLKYRLLFGVRTEADIYYREELDRMCKTLPDFRYDFVLSRGSPAWTGRRGYVQDHIQDFSYLQTPSTFYLCGNGGMIKSVKEKLGGEGFDPTRIWAEAFD